MSLVVGLVVGELIIAALLWVVFIVIHACGPWYSTRSGRQLMAMAIVGLLETLGLLMIGLNHPLPLWMYVVIFGFTDALMIGWLVLIVKARVIESRLRSRVKRKAREVRDQPDAQ